ncbi:hypothetical protein H5410_020019 [Solanum commersonii]|uniref:Uncharacterized protein n=1 Tax=Solanum commersonii TaxID=4109 RepID=A0A9J5Z7X2_SOLCO|nr:hypothetical protein H5410_020019 [Solanum commersonii]
MAKNDHQYGGGGVGGGRLAGRLCWAETTRGHISIPKEAFSIKLF